MIQHLKKAFLMHCKKSIVCKIADCIVEIPATGDMVTRCRNYLYEGNAGIDFSIQDEMYNLERWKGLSERQSIYIESGFQFYKKLLAFNGLMIHSSAVEVDGKAYLFSGPSTVGKSTHTHLLKRVFGNDEVIIFNDDKPAIRRLEEKWFAYGTPWSGKNGLNQNKKVPLVGICFLKQGEDNVIRRLEKKEIIRIIISQTSHKLKTYEQLDLMLALVDQLVREIPIYELTNRPEPEAARLSYETMRRGAEEAGL